MTCLGLLLAVGVIIAFDLCLARHLWRRDRKNQGESQMEMDRRLAGP